MTRIETLIDVQELRAAVAGGYISERSHPKYPELSILNYTEKAAYEGMWNAATLTCRGLIYNVVTNEVLARPFKKFFNYGQTGAPEIDLDARLLWVQDKADGSLGIGFQYDGELHIATRGSFASEQADHANEWVRKHADTTTVRDAIEAIEDGFTPLFEIIYPENRIVLNYGSDDYLLPLGVVAIATGNYWQPLDGQVKEFNTFGELLAAPDRPNAEGWVAWLDRQTAVKIKQEDYIALHRIVTGLNRKSIWRALKEGEPTYKALAAQLPDELYAWADGVAKEIRLAYSYQMQEIDHWYIELLESDVWAVDLDDVDSVDSATEVDRKKFALAVQAVVPAEYRGFMFSLLDQRDIQDKVWNMVEPIGGDK